MTSPNASWMLIGRIIGAFGVRGELKAELLTDFPDRFRSLSNVYLGEERKKVELTGARRHKKLVLLRLAGVESPDQADAQRGQEIFVPRSESVPLDHDQYFIEDVIGIAAESESGTPIGHVSEVLRTGSNDVFVLQTRGGEVLVPATKDAVPRLDLATRSMTVASWVLQDPL